MKCKAKIVKGYRLYPCSRKAQEGKEFCFQHDPEKKAKDNREKFEAYKKKVDAQRNAHLRSNIALRLYEGEINLKQFRKEMEKVNV